MPRPPSVLRRALAGTAFGALVVAALLALVEAGLAVAGLPDPGLFEGDPATLWTLRPELDREVRGPAGPFRVRTNALGLRGPPPPEAGPWTLALGCSTTFGWGVEAEEAWPAALARLLDEPVVNGGVPGWSTEQARRGAGRWLGLRPDRVILAYIVRDAQAAAIPDERVPPTPWPWRTHLGRLLAGLRAPRGVAGPDPVAEDPARSRVPPPRYAANLDALVAAVGDAEVVLLAFPQPAARAARMGPWVAALTSRGWPALAPRLSDDSFFADDPVHLTAAGHRRLAEALAAAIGPVGRRRP